MPKGIYKRGVKAASRDPQESQDKLNKRAKLGPLESAIAELFEEMYWTKGVDPQTPEIRASIEKVRAKRPKED